MTLSLKRGSKISQNAFAALMALFALALVLLSPLPAEAQSGAHLDRDITILQTLVANQPDAELYYRLGDLYVQKGRQTGDITYFNLAKNALLQSLKLEPDLGASHRHLAYVLYSLHDFAGAADESRTAIKLDPRDSYAYGVLGDSQLETGKYPEATQTYGQMVALKGDLYSYSRRSGIETVHGHNAAAVADLKRAIADGFQDGQPREGIAWAQVRLAEDLFLMGNLDDAAVQAMAALQTYPGYHRALAVIAQVRAAQGRFAEAAQAYRGAIAVIPFPQYAAALGDVYAAAGCHQQVGQMHQLVEFIARLNTLNKVLYNRVLVDYYADHDLNHQEAVDLAQSEFKIRHDIYGEDALAWSLYRDHKSRAALAHMRAAVRFKTADARLYFHAGMIYAALGRNAEARASLQRALAINPHFQPLLDVVAAREYAELGGKATPQLVTADSSHPQMDCHATDVLH